jgi:hypothetical protein
MDTKFQPDSLSIDTTQDAVTVALSLSEILSCIFSFLRHDRKTLASATCVNRIWFDEVTRFRWITSNTKNLIAVEASRRKIYAPKIREFTLQDVFGHPNLDLEFRLLQVLHFTTFPGFQDVNVCQYLQPALEEVYFTGWPPNVFLQGLNSHCPRLRVMVQTKPSFKEKHNFIDFFTSNQSLKRVQLTLIPLDRDRMAAAFHALSKLPLLEDLTILGETYKGTLIRLQKLRLSEFDDSGSDMPGSDMPDPDNSFSDSSRSGYCFDSVRMVKLTVSAPALSLLSLTFSAMTTLSLVVHMRTDDDSLEALAGLPLESLELRRGVGVRLRSHELLFLRNAKSLKSLIIKPEPFNPNGQMSTLKIEEDHFEQIFEKLSALETLLIWFTLDMPASDITMKKLGRSCPKLENLRLYVPVDLLTWLDTAELLFPNLKFAWISSVIDQNIMGESDDANAELMATILDRHAPKLDRFVALSSYAFRPANADMLSSLVMRYHGRIKETGQTRRARDEARGMVAR